MEYLFRLKDCVTGLLPLRFWKTEEMPSVLSSHFQRLVSHLAHVPDTDGLFVCFENCGLKYIQ